MRGPLFHFRKMTPAVGIYMLDYFILVYYYFAPFFSSISNIYVHSLLYIRYILLFLLVCTCAYSV